jgi:hypothetical protein
MRLSPKVGGRKRSAFPHHPTTSRRRLAQPVALSGEVVAGKVRRGSEFMTDTEITIHTEPLAATSLTGYRRTCCAWESCSSSKSRRSSGCFSRSSLRVRASRVADENWT